MNLSSFALLFQSFCILTIIFIGLIFRKKRKLHIPIMLTAIIWDIILVIEIEVFRSATDKAIKFATNSTLLNVHIIFATLTIILYFVIISTGLLVIYYKISLIKTHRIIGIMAVIMRILVLITSIFIET